VSSDEDHQTLVVNFISISAFCDSSLWLEKWLFFCVFLTQSHVMERPSPCDQNNLEAWIPICQTSIEQSLPQVLPV
jgi:hypothetical protein